MRTLLALVLMLIGWILGGLAPDLPGQVQVAPASLHGAADPGPAHGAYCRMDHGAAVFLGRDLGGSVSYPEFDAWCVAREGRTGWAA